MLFASNSVALRNFAWHIEFGHRYLSLFFVSTFSICCGSIQLCFNQQQKQRKQQQQPERKTLCRAMECWRICADKVQKTKNLIREIIIIYIMRINGVYTATFSDCLCFYLLRSTRRGCLRSALN